MSIFVHDGFEYELQMKTYGNDGYETKIYKLKDIFNSAGETTSFNPDDLVRPKRPEGLDALCYMGCGNQLKFDNTQKEIKKFYRNLFWYKIEKLPVKGTYDDKYPGWVEIVDRFEDTSKKKSQLSRPYGRYDDDVMEGSVKHFREVTLPTGHAAQVWENYKNKYGTKAELVQKMIGSHLQGIVEKNKDYSYVLIGYKGIGHTARTSVYGMDTSIGFGQYDMNDLPQGDLCALLAFGEAVAKVIKDYADSQGKKDFVYKLRLQVDVASHKYDDYVLIVLDPKNTKSPKRKLNEW